MVAGVISWTDKLVGCKHVDTSETGIISTWQTLGLALERSTQVYDCVCAGGGP